MRVLGLEWLWRLLREPKRIGRIWNAVVIFPLLVFLHGKNAPK
jgi:UDP-N-acetyl-D-mannosaminuronic acid transferase (WecB/TagA/CpsF family)